MPLNKRKLRKILIAIDPSSKADLLVDQLKEDTTENLNELVKKVSVKFKELKDSLLKEFDERLKQAPDLSEELVSLESELEARLQELEKEEIPNIQAQMQDLVSNEIEASTLKEDLEDRIEEIRNEFHRRLGNLGGGSPIRAIMVSSSVISSRYLDVNFIPGSIMSIATADDNVNKRVNFTLSSTGVSSSVAAATYVPYTGATGAVDLGVNGLTIDTFTFKGDLNSWSSGAWSFYSDEGITQTGKVEVPFAGQYRFYDDSLSVPGILDFTSLTTSDKTFTFPDATGTIALTSDIPTLAGLLSSSIALTAQVLDITDTAFTVNTAGLYRISYYMLDTTADALAGAVTLNIKFTDNAAARTISSSPVVLTATTGFTQGEIIVRLASGNVTYGVTHTGIFGNAVYALYVTQEKLQ